MGNDKRVEHLRDMIEIRLFENAVFDLRVSGEYVGSTHLYNGQEAIAVGACAALGEGDAVFSTYRGHGWAMARGVPALSLFAELLNRTGGICEGRGGSAYFTAPDHGFFGENSIVGAGAPIAVGAALAAKYDDSDRVTLTAFGDGAMNQGAVTEAMNFAATFDLPVIFVCENNSYSELTPIRDMVREQDLTRRPEALGIPAQKIDGNDVVAVEAAISGAVAEIRSKSGPVFFEMMTQRLQGHYVGDPEHYRPKGEIESYKDIEPIARLRRELNSNGITDAELEQITAEASKTIDRALSQAKMLPGLEQTAVRDVREHVYG
ncbi:MAG: thiamine pyrophosphate-dependent dehydrogenase E1 component subunit alpha [Paracoccaceae bacterium]|nr:thiamine pyrophosphate-dependent dehydrogenase E1 component subunit alpha [Paracoccaceae bacterium]